MHCDGVWLLTATGVSALLLTDQSGKPLAACGAEALRRIGVEAIFQHLAVDLNDMFYTQPEWPRLTDKARAEVEGSCLEPAVRACPSQPSHGRRPATGAPHGRMPPQPPIARRPHMALSLHTPRPRQPSVRLSQRKSQKVQPPTAVWLRLRGSSGSAGRPTPSTAGLAIAPAAMSLSM